MALIEHGEQCPACGTRRLHRIKQAWVCPSCGFYDGCCEGEPAHAGTVVAPRRLVRTVARATMV